MITGRPLMKDKPPRLCPVHGVVTRYWRETCHGIVCAEVVGRQIVKGKERKRYCRHHTTQAMRVRDA